MNIDDKKLKKILQEQREEYQHYLGACMKNVNSKIEAITKQYLDITKTLDIHTETIGLIKVDAEIIKTDIEFIKSRLKKKVDTEEFESLEKRVIRLEKLSQSQKTI